MSFREAEATDANLAGIAAILHDALEKPGYARNRHQIYENMDSDPLIGPLSAAGRPASRLELLQHINNHRANPPVILGEAVNFCLANLQQGTLTPFPDTTYFGHVQSMQSVINRVAGAASSLGLGSAEALVRDAITSTADAATKLARQKSDFAGNTLSRNQMWCYPASDPGNPFAEIGTTRAEAVNILGLGFYAVDEPATELVRWAHVLPDSIEAHAPTAWDAGAYVYWRPGGRTYRLDRDDYGVTEVVHNPIGSEDLTVAIELLP